jgi:dolichyl-phosphate-mannose-protein mannosyltransferase
MNFSTETNSERRWLIPVAAILFLTCGLRTVQYVARSSFWLDELSMVSNFEKRSLTELVSRPLGEQQVAPAGFLAAVKVSSAVLGLNELGLRFIPWISALAGVFLFWRVARRVLNGPALLAGLLIFAVSPALIWYGGNVKPYSSDIAATLLLVLLALRFEERPGDHKAAMLAGFAGVPILFISFPAIVTAAVLGLVLLWRWLRDRPRNSIVPLLCVGVPWGAGALAAGLLALKLVDPETNAYMRRFWVDGFPPAPWTSIEALQWVPQRLMETLGFFMFFLAADGTAGRIVAAGFSVLACIGLVLLFRKFPRQAPLIVAPTIAAILAASARLLPFRDRVGLWAGWPLLILSMVGLQAFYKWISQRARVAAVGLTVLTAGASVVLSFSWARPPYHCQDTRPVLAAVEQRRHDGDILYVYYGAREAMDFYGRRAGFKEWTTGECHREEPREYFREVDQFRGHPRVWFFYTHSAFGYREPKVIRSYFETIGTEHERITGPSSADAHGQCEAVASLYDLSDTTRLAAATWDTYEFPDTRTGETRILCDGTRVTGK